MNKLDRKQHKKIILFLCNWGPHAAFLELQDKRSEIPDEVHMVRIPCTGRIDRALLLKAFSMGADGVALVGCYAGTCRYGSGTATAQRNTEDMGKILETLGINNQRLRCATFLPEDAEGLLGFLQSFCADIGNIGSTHIHSSEGNTLPAPSGGGILLNCHDAGFIDDAALLPELFLECRHINHPRCSILSE